MLKRKILVYFIVLVLVLVGFTALVSCGEEDGNNGDSCQCVDRNNDHDCDLCGGWMSYCRDYNEDHFCDICNKKLSQCYDNKKDHRCDFCGIKIRKHCHITFLLYVREQS